MIDAVSVYTWYQPILKFRYRGGKNGIGTSLIGYFVPALLTRQCCCLVSAELLMLNAGWV